MERAKKRVEALKAFYIHAVVYLIVNGFILVSIYLNTDDFWQWGHFFTLIFWGAGLAFQAFWTFFPHPFFGRQWEERQIRKYMEKEEEEAQKYR